MSAIRSLPLSPGVSPEVLSGQPDVHLDAHQAVDELEILNAGIELAGPEVAAGLEPLVQRYQGELTNGDHLRLGPPPSASQGPSPQGALRRILTSDRAAELRAQGGDDAETRMLKAVVRFANTVADIQRQSAVEGKGA